MSRDGPSGARVVVVGSGECIGSISYRHGFFWETLWNLPENAGLKELRKDPGVLAEGDRVHVPALRQKGVSCATGKRHVFRRKGVPALFRIQLSDDWEARSGLRYVVEIDGRRTEGKADAEGRIMVSISPAAKKGTLTLFPEEGEPEVCDLDFGALQPIDTDEGVRMRLQNLGYELEDENSQGALVESALRRFQALQDLPVTGLADDATRRKLLDLHGS